MKNRSKSKVLITWQVLMICMLAGITSNAQFHPSIAQSYNPDLAPFYFGVASGDPHPHDVLLWTKVVPEQATGAQQVEWELSADSSFTKVLKSGTATATPESAYTVKVLVDGLEPGTYYFYRFRNGERWSPIGRTKTAPDGEVNQLRLAVISCVNYTSGYFNALEHLAHRKDIDVVLHLGDYIYEYGGGGNRKKGFSRPHIPPHECISLEDYRSRYAQYRLDPQLQEAHRLHPFIIIWDDHETANNSYATGAQNHDPRREGSWEERKNAAVQAWFEWMPIPGNPSTPIIRKFSFGKLADLWMLDERLTARSPQARGVDDPVLNDSTRHMIGEEQRKWLLEGMLNSEARWKVIGNQVIFSPLHDSRVFSRNPTVRMDRWDGYPAERQKMFDFWYRNGINNIVVLTGDVHTSWAFELTADPLDPNVYDRKTGKGVIGAEFTTPSISSFNFDEVVPKFITWEAKRRFKRKKHNPHLRFLDLNRHGYLTLTLTPDAAQADWYFAKTILKQTDRIKHCGPRILNYDEKQLNKK
ncbi:MAG: hypothetical protein CMN32_06520 [Saprospirales bacterium]|nr:hypothetical protein [Saprospirales bacterium]